MNINDITESITSDIRLFADDCILYRCISSIGDCIALQHDIDTLLAWSETWKMHFNPSRPEFGKGVLNLETVCVQRFR